MTNQLLFAKEYKGDELSDITIDIQDMLDEVPYNKLPKRSDGWGKRGVFHVSIIWKDDE